MWEYLSGTRGGLPDLPDAACAGYPPDWWFPGRGDDGAKAKAICATCPERVKCLAWAMEHHVTAGIWGQHAFTRDHSHHRRRRSR